jgi:MarR family transcriptional regulator for hemolysin
VKRSKELIELRAKQVEVYLMASRIVRAIDQRVTEGLAAQGLDVTSAQVNLLGVLVQARRPLAAAELARLMALSEVTVGRLVRTLAERGWVTREPDPEDARAFRVAPTQRTYDEFPRFLEIVNALADDAWSGIGEDEVEVTLATERKVWANLSREGGRFAR